MPRAKRADVVAAGLRGIVVHALRPAGGVCVATHGMMADHRTLAPARRPGLADLLAERGLHVVCLDLPRHGRNADIGWDLERMVRAQFPDAVAEIARRFPGLPIVLLGHSLGGVLWLASLAVADPALSVAGLVTVNTNVWCPRSDRNPLRIAAKRALLASMRVLARGGDVPARRYRLGTNDVPREFLTDLVRWSRRGWTLHEGGDALDERLATTHVPVLAMTTRGDRLLCVPQVARWLHARLPAVEQLLLPGPARHMDLVTEAATSYRQHWTRPIEWITARCDRPGGTSSADLADWSHSCDQVPGESKKRQR
ncbi:MAG: alpha/beta fold hydrolase [Pseudonocardiaceae bacterium]